MNRLLVYPPEAPTCAMNVVYPRPARRQWAALVALLVALVPVGAAAGLGLVYVGLSVFPGLLLIGGAQ